MINNKTHNFVQECTNTKDNVNNDFSGGGITGRTRGENGQACLTAEGLGDSLLALFDRFFQGIDEVDLRNSLRKILIDARRTEGREIVIDTFVMAFSARWCRGGKGAKLPFYQCIKMLYEDFPSVVLKLLPLVPQFGYWKDYFLLLQEVDQYPVEGVVYAPLTQEVWRLYAKQLQTDYAQLEACKANGTKPSISFAGKYAPREKKQFAKSLHAVSELALRMFPPLYSDMSTIGTFMEEEKKEGHVVKPNRKRYREVVTALTNALDVPEVKMCAHRYAAINMATVPSRCMKAQSKAFANELKDSTPTPAQEATGNRHPDDDDRVTARQHLLKALMDKDNGVKGGQVYPNEFVAQICEGNMNSMLDELTVNAQWSSMRESIVKMINDRVALKADGSSGGSCGGVALGKLVPLCDVSRSMDGSAMDVSIGLGILCSELTHTAFRDLVLCFSEEAQWYSLAGCSGIVEKVAKLYDAPWDMNTDFELAMDRILKVVIDNNLQQEDIPNLLVISDMQFDDASDGVNWNTAYENIERQFHDAGVRKYGKPLTPPTIVFWNVRASIGFPAASDQMGVVMLSGFSPALLKFVLSGELEREEEVVIEEEVVVVGSDGVSVSVKKAVTKKVKRISTPSDTMRTALHEEAYEPIREVLKGCTAEELALGLAPLSRPYSRRIDVVDIEKNRVVGEKFRRPFTTPARGGRGGGRKIMGRSRERSNGGY